jgi:sucrose-6-phosphate hydrolase SacC (GH32 family)
MLLVMVGCGNYGDFALSKSKTDATTARGFAWSAQAEPVIARGERSDVLNPSVVKFRGEYWNLYSEYDGKQWHTAAATSKDGVRWIERGRILSPNDEEGSYIAANGSAVVVGDELFYWYEVGYPLRIVLARSRDGSIWTRESSVALKEGPYGSFDERAVADPYVIHVDDVFYMYYLGQDRAVRQRLGVARSRDGLVWEKLRSNPVMEGVVGAFDEDLGEPAVWNSGSEWWMLYTGRAKNEQRRLGLAHSSDGVTWNREDFKISGEQEWNKAVLCDPSVELQPDGSVRVWFGGGDAAKPDQTINGQIGVGVLRPK